MATTASSAANSSSHILRYSLDASTSRSRTDSSPWLSGDSEVITDDPAPSVSSSAVQDDPCFPSVSHSVSPPAGKDCSDHDNADKKPVWNKPSNSSTGVPPLMGAESWPALSLSARASSNKSPSFESFRGLSDGPSTMPVPQAGGDRLDYSHRPTTGNASSSASATSSENHTLNGPKRPFRRNNSVASSSSNISHLVPSDNAGAAPLNTISTRDQKHTQRGGSYGTGPTNYRASHRNRNNNSYPRGDGIHHQNHGNRRHYDHGNQSGFPHRNHNGRGVHLQPPRGFGMMRPQMLMGPPSFPTSSAPYMAAPQIGPYGGPMLHPDFMPHMYMQHPPPESMGLFGHFPPQPMYFPGFDPLLYSKILSQVDYYFSADNLSTESYLRQQMNDEGWVLVSVIAKFRKLAELTNNSQTILDALRSSEVVEIQGEAIRRRGDWKKYLWPRELSGLRPAAAPAPAAPTAPAPAAAEPDNSTSLESELEGMTVSEKIEG